jgi:hypothetical protein
MEEIDVVELSRIRGGEGYGESVYKILLHGKIRMFH